ncbi:MAG TPA: glycosyltransferase [Phycisphaerae bacterium]|nr:glycosyltransferase [Phycisphaerae bacterium]
MIFVTVGTQYFDELIDEVDRLAGLGAFGQPVLAQIGLAKRKPKNVDYVIFDKNMLQTARGADMIITHAGTGSLCEFITLGRPFIAVVNDTKAGNHQLEFLEHLSSLYDFCWICSPRDLEQALPHARPATPLSKTAEGMLAADIRAFLKARLAPQFSSPSVTT